MAYRSSKNKLQEILQQQGHGPPKYTTVAVPEGFRATVTLPDGNSYTGEPMTRKRHAEILAAAAALPHVEPAVKQIVASACVFVDLENVPKLIDVLCTRVDSPNVKVFGFHSQNIDFPADHLPDNFTIVQVPSVHRDAADVGILLYMGGCLTKTQYQHVAIVTKDHFAMAAADCVSAWSSKEVKVCRDAEGVIDWLESL